MYVFVVYQSRIIVFIFVFWTFDTVYIIILLENTFFPVSPSFFVVVSVCFVFIFDLVFVFYVLFLLPSFSFIIFNSMKFCDVIFVVLELISMFFHVPPPPSPFITHPFFSWSSFINHFFVFFQNLFRFFSRFSIVLFIAILLMIMVIFIVFLMVILIYVFIIIILIIVFINIYVFVFVYFVFNFTFFIILFKFCFYRMIFFVLHFIII